MNKKRQLITIDEAVEAKGQHKKPCSDCPFARTSLPGWLGGESVDAWMKEAHGNLDIPCHTLRGAQCAGSAIYRTNVLKRNVADGVLLLPADRERVFATPMEFMAHHNSGPKGSAPFTKGTVMPKADVVAKNLALGSQKAKYEEKLTKLKAGHDSKLAKIAAGHAKALAAQTKKTEASGAKVLADMKKLKGLVLEISQQTRNVGVADSVRVKAKIDGLVAKATTILVKYPDEQPTA